MKYDASKNVLYIDIWFMGDCFINDEYFRSNLLKIIQNYIAFDDFECWLSKLNV